MSPRKFRLGFRVLWTAAALAAVVLLDRLALNVVNPYVYRILVLCGLNVMLALSLNLVNGITGQFSIGHAGFMAVGAYTSVLLTMHVLPPGTHAILFPLAVLAGGTAAGLTGLLVALPSFKVRGDYLAIFTLAFLMIVKSAL